MKQQADNSIEKAEKQRKLNRVSGIATCLFLLTGSEGVANFHLSAHFCQDGNAIGKPHIHAGSAHRCYSVAADAANPDHVGQVVRHLDK